MDTPELTLPHPRLSQRRFVLAPLAAIAPRMKVPPENSSVAELLSRLDDSQPVETVAWSIEPLS